MKNFIKSIFVGIANIIPGLSGSALLIIFDLYEKCIEAISNIFSDFKKSIKFLFPIGCGIVIGTFAFSKVIHYCLNHYLMTTSIIFVGFMLGTLPNLFKEATKKGFKERYLIPFIITFTLGVSLLFFKSNTIVYEIDLNLIWIIKLILLGSIISLSTIIPGISSTVLLSLMGMYGIYLNSINTLNIKLLIPIAIGFAITSFFLSKLINYLLDNYYGYTYFGILGFTISTIPALIFMELKFNTTLIFSIVLGILAFILTYYTFEKSNKN